jgi:hypothetical protein
MPPLDSSTILNAVLYFISITLMITGVIVPIAIPSDIWGLVMTFFTLIMTLVLANTLHCIFANDATIMFIFYTAYNFCIAIIMWRGESQSSVANGSLLTEPLFSLQTTYVAAAQQ